MVFFKKGGCKKTLFLQTYVEWNLHEPRPGQFDLEGRRDVFKFIQVGGKHIIWHRFVGSHIINTTVYVM